MAGDLIHFEIPAGDHARAQRFWSSLLGWTWNATPDEQPYMLTRAGGEGPAGGMYRAATDERGLIPYFSVEDLDASMERVVELDGAVRSSGDVPGTGRFAHCVDTEGNPFSLFWVDPAGHGTGPRN